MPSIKELREEQARVITEARSLNDTITPATVEADARSITEQVDRALARSAELDVQIERQQKIDDAMKRMETQADPRRPGADIQARAQDAADTISYRSAFAAYIRNAGDVSNLTSEQRDVLRAGAADTPELRVQTAGTTTAGGFTVPTELQAGIFKAMAAYGPMYDENVAFTLNTASGNPLTFTTVNDTATAVVKHTEGSQFTDDNGSDVTFGQVTLSAHAYNTEWVQVSLELLQDSIENMETVIADLLGERLGRRVNTELTTGDGTGDPQGVVTGSTLGKTTAGTTAITADELIDLLHSVDPAYRSSPRAAFMFNDSTLAAIRKLKDSENRYIWQMGDIRNGVPGTLLGYNYFVNQAMASIPSSASATRVAIFGDFSKYYVRKVGGPVIGVARERFFPQVGLAGVVRLDGRIMDTRAIKHLITAAS